MMFFAVAGIAAVAIICWRLLFALGMWIDSHPAVRYGWRDRE